jgi:hypothetical protein
LTGGRVARAIRALLLGALALGAAGAAEAAGRSPDPGAAAGGGGGSAVAHVIYLTGGSVYIDAGREQGIAVGDTARVTRGGSTVALLRVAFVSSSKASCDTIRIDSPVKVGDAVRYVPGAAPEPGAVAPGDGAAVDSASGAGRAAVRPGPAGGGVASSGRTKGGAGRRARPVRGRVGVGLLTVPGAGGGPGYTQPSLTLRMDGAAASGAPLDFSIDVRGHRTYRAGDEDGAARVYRLSTALRDAASTRRLSVGRQALPVSSSASLIDGALAQLDGKRVSVGVFSGLEPAPGGYDFSPDIVQSGGFLQWRNAPRAAARWSLTGGFVDSRHGGAVNRDFAFAQGAYFSRPLMLTFSQEVDLNPAWKRAMGEPSLSLTSTFATARVQVSPRVTANGGFDNRRNVRLLRDRETPETEFDDRYRQGGWLGATVEPVRSVRVGGSARVRSGGAAGAAWTYSGSVEAFRLTSLRGSLRARTARVTSDVEEGWLHSFGLDATLWAGARAGVTVGTQRFTEIQTGGRRLTDWQSVNVDLGLARRWYVLLSAEHDRDDAGSRVQSYSSLNWMF